MVSAFRVLALPTDSDDVVSLSAVIVFREMRPWVIRFDGSAAGAGKMSIEQLLFPPRTLYAHVPIPRVSFDLAESMTISVETDGKRVHQARIVLGLDDDGMPVATLEDR